jgi:putative ABC transport system permease protein
MPRVEFGGLISNGDKSAPFKGYGIDVEKEMLLIGGLSEINHHLKLGEQLIPLKKGKPGIILGKTLANTLHAKVGDVLMIYSVTADGAINGLDAELLGVMATGVNETDKYYLLTTIDVVQRVLNVNKVSLLSVMFTGRDHLKKKLQQLENDLKKYPAFNGLKLTSWEEGADFYVSIRDIFNIIFTFMGCIILAIVLLSCWNIMNMTAMERIREIGTLRAIGLNIKNISTVFLLEAFLIGIIGVVIGLVLQLVISRFINSLEIIMPPVPGMDRPYTLQVFGMTRFHPFISLGIILAITVSSLSSFLLIKRFSIIESLEHT